jgi:hypothetical protein
MSAASPNGPSETDRWQTPGARRYLIVGLGALLGLTLALAEKRHGLWSLAPLMLGSAALVGCWRAGPAVLVTCVTVMLVARGANIDPLTLFLALSPWGIGQLPPVRLFSAGGIDLADLGVGATLVGYAAAQYRLQGILGHALPPNIRPQGPPREGEDEPVYRRPVESGGVGEMSGLLLVLVGAPAAAVLLWAWISRTPAPFDLAGRLWRPVLLLWLAGLTALLASVGLRVLGWKQASPEAHRLYLQDVFWQETRREQTRINRWMTWARLRRQRQQEKS